MSLNQVQLIGNLGANPEIISLASGNKTTFSVATNERYTDKNGNPKTDTEWHSVICWGNLADITAKYLKKGSSVFVQGKIKTRSYDDANGQKRYITEVIASSVQFLDAKAQDSQQAPFDNGYQQQPQNGYQQQPIQNHAPQNQAPMNNGYQQQPIQNHAPVNNGYQQQPIQNHAHAPQNQAPQNQAPMNNGYQNNAPQNQAPMNNSYQNNAPQNQAPMNNSYEQPPIQNHAPQNQAPMNNGYPQMPMPSQIDNDIPF